MALTVADNESAPKGIHEAFAQFFEQPTRPALRKLLQGNLGEFDHVDFKRQWPNGPKLARSILAFANSSGGVMVVGVTEDDDNSLAPDGLSALTDKTDICNSVKKFLPNDLDYIVLDFAFSDCEYAALKGKQFQVLVVEDRPERLPFVAIAGGDDIKSGAIYVRDGIAAVVANHYQLQNIINRRISTGHSSDREMTLKEHLDELKILYAAIPERITSPLFRAVTSISSLAAGISEPNPSYPQEGFEAFIVRMIEVKKKVIETVLRDGRRGRA
jgi:hypothetical protein